MVQVETREQMHALGAHIAGKMLPGDLIVLVGDLGAGKTTFVQGLGKGLGVTDPITSPTFVIARAHKGPTLPLVHVDAYRLGSRVELDELDLDADLETSITVVEWGEGKVEQLAEDRLVISIERSDSDDETRQVSFVGVGNRWSDAALLELSPTW
jgi:tRNA threonylcarbamoyladenosine biosynthesis protein TsaE